jgi:hypothetical protein
MTTRLERQVRLYSLGLAYGGEASMRLRVAERLNDRESRARIGTVLLASMQDVERYLLLDALFRYYSGQHAAPQASSPLLGWTGRSQRAADGAEFAAGLRSWLRGGGTVRTRKTGTSRYGVGAKFRRVRGRSARRCISRGSSGATGMSGARCGCN